MEKLSKQELLALHQKSYEMRFNILRMMRYGEGHIGGAFSSLDILTVLYNKVLKHEPGNPKWEDRDRFILSAGHKCLALYVTLAEQGYFDTEILWTYNTLNTRVPMHPDEKALPGIEFPNGSLGHGLSVANGMALAGRLDKKEYRIFVLLGDGECAEGSVWEAAMAASHHKLDKIIAIVDRNGLQVNGRTSQVMDTSPLEAKFEAFGWEVKIIDGHDFTDIYQSLKSVPFRTNKPSAIIADTIKCKGLDFAEDQFQYHHWHCEPEKIDQMIVNVENKKKEERAKIV